MPSTSPAQKRLMAAAAHTKGGFGGVPQSVGKDFNQADKGKKFNRGGSVEGSKEEEAHDPSAEQAFENNAAETIVYPTGPIGLRKGGSVHRSWKRWGSK